MKKLNENKFGLVILIIGLVLVFLMPYLLTQYSLIDFTKTGNIGDTIGGITAPISGLVGSILVYLALRAQIDANKSINKQLTDQKEEQRRREIYTSFQFELKKLDDDLDTFSFIHLLKSKSGEPKEANLVKGAMAIELFLEDFIEKSKKFCTEFNNKKTNLVITYPNLKVLYILLRRFKLLSDRILLSELEGSDKDYLLKLLVFSYDLKISLPMHKFEIDKSLWSKSCRSCNSKHQGIPMKLMNLLSDIDLQTIVPIKDRLKGDFKRVEFFIDPGK